MTAQSTSARATIIHGYFATPDDHWFGWLADQLGTLGLRVSVPTLPNPQNPEPHEWENAVARAVGTPDENAVIVAHSLGCLTVLRYLCSLHDPWRLGTLVLVAGFTEQLPSLPDLDRYIGNGCDLDGLRDHIDHIVVLRSDNDPLVPAELTDRLAEELGVRTDIVPDAGHFLATDGCTTLPDALDVVGNPTSDATRNSSSAVVVGGGGLSAIGWSTGVLAALEEQGVLRLRNQDLVVGTSAGAAVAAAVLQSGTAVLEFDHMVRKSCRNEESAPDSDLSTVFPEVIGIHDRETPVQEKARDFLRLTGRAVTVDPRRRRSSIASRLHSDNWPDANLIVTTVDDSGCSRRFTRTSGVSLVDAVTASCAVPGLWPAVDLDGRAYMDGGTFSLTNAEIAASADQVLVLQPMPEAPGYATPARSEVYARATVLEPSDRSREGFGENPFDPDVRGIAAVLGYEDGLRAAARLEVTE